MTVLTVSITDQAFDKKSSEVNYLVKVIDLIQAHLETHRGTQTGSQNVLGQNQAGAANTIVATYTYTPSATNPYGQRRQTHDDRRQHAPGCPELHRTVAQRGARALQGPAGICRPHQRSF
jgi:hypothetical protein